MTARAERIAAAEQAAGIAYDLLDSLPLEEATDAAMRAGGPSREEVRALIAKRRGYPEGATA